ncbi:MvaI/BcnI family restriction endonuclease [Pseudohongiella acticola]|jgi:MvaI/BcnI restriction endonuclease family|uniref:MvaI/BcnI family restriction endonuclease n=1 Tax=Pseudohongiella acticola TaxID=1524254 RepID=UPI0030EE49E3
MPIETGTYDSPVALEANLDRILNILSDLGASNVYVKRLAPNDNSKNQPYFGSHLTDLSFIPSGEIVPSETTSEKPAAKRKIKYQASVKLCWVDANGQTYPAPNSKLIYYPQYPEVRFSGFLLGSQVKLSHWMSPDKAGRAEGRWLILGVAPDETVYAYLATPKSMLARELRETELIGVSPVFGEIGRRGEVVASTRAELLAKLLEIHELGWIAGQRLGSSGRKVRYKAQNAGGYTLEAELGVSPNGIAEPDFLGWEVKQFGVTAFPAAGTKPTTLMTPEPNGGYYTEQGVQEFVRKYGYPDKSGRVDRLNFGGKHLVGKVCGATALTMVLTGFDSESALITDAKGAVMLIDSAGSVAASWSFAKLMDHWKRKHAQAVYVPALRRQAANDGYEYHYGKDVELGIGTHFELILSAMAGGHVFYDPGIKLENASNDAAKLKRRSQFRVSHRELSSLYKSYEFLDLQK